MIYGLYHDGIGSVELIDHMGMTSDRSTVAKYTRGLCPQIRVVR